MATSTKNILIKRYSGSGKAFFQKYELKFHNDTTVLDALLHIKDTLDSTLTFRWSCRMGMCGSCAAVVNGKEVLMCQTNLMNLREPIPPTIQPLRNFPIIKDLVVDLNDAFEKIKKTNPYIERMREKALEDGEYFQTDIERKALEQTSQCIKCMICYSACPVYGLDKDFIGPAAGVTAFRYNADSRDKSQKKRLDAVSGAKGVWKCSFVGQCSAMCPKRVDPAETLQRLKLMGALRMLKKIIKP